MVLLCFLATSTAETLGSITLPNSRQKQARWWLSGKWGCSTNLGAENPCHSCLQFMVQFTVKEKHALNTENYVPRVLIWLIFYCYFSLVNFAMWALQHYPLYLLKHVKKICWCWANTRGQTVAPLKAPRGSRMLSLHLSWTASPLLQNNVKWGGDQRVSDGNRPTGSDWRCL